MVVGRFKVCPADDGFWIVKERVKFLWFWKRWETLKTCESLDGGWTIYFKSLVSAHEHIAEIVDKERRIAAHEAQPCVPYVDGGQQ